MELGILHPGQQRPVQLLQRLRRKACRRQPGHDTLQTCLQHLRLQAHTHRHGRQYPPPVRSQPGSCRTATLTRDVLLHRPRHRPGREQLGSRSRPLKRKGDHMPDATVRVETRELPARGDGRPISARRFSSANLADHEDDLRKAIHSVLTTMMRAVEEAPVSPLRLGGLEVDFNVAFTPDDGAYLCSSPADGTFAVKLSMTLPEPSAGGEPTTGEGSAEGDGSAEGEDSGEGAAVSPSASSG